LPRHAYINANGVVMQVVSGAVDGVAHDALLRDYGALYGAVRCVRVVDAETPVWIGGTYDEATGFTPPPAPEPQPEPQPEPLLEPEA